MQSLYRFFVAALLLSAGSAKAVPLESTDVSVLVPLKAFSDKDEVFKVTGTGMCNALGLGQIPGGFLTASQFSAFAFEAFARGPSGQCNSRNDLPVGGGNDAHVLGRTPSQHLALFRSIPGRACNQASWKVVSFRLNLCVERPGKTFRYPSDLEGCTSQLRVVAQPFFTGDGAPFPDDMAMHLIYKVPSIAQVVTDLKTFADVTRTATAGKSWDEYDSKPSTLRPHPGLRLEMNNCNGAVSKAYRTFLGKHAKSSMLDKIAFLTSSTVQTQWTMGEMRWNGKQFSSLDSRAGGSFDSFSSEVFDVAGFPINASLKNSKDRNVALFYLPNALGKKSALTSEENKRLTSSSATLNAIENPHSIGNENTNCMSCHLTTSVRTELINRDVTLGTAERYPFQGQFPVWPPFEEDLRGPTNFRNFGYGPGFEMGVARRTINETHDTVQALKHMFP